VTSAVSGHWNQIAQAVLPPSTSTLRAALLFAQLNAAQWDASIAAYRQKYADKFWRPITAINQGDASNPTLKDATWVPFLSTPAHPEHPSGAHLGQAPPAAKADENSMQSAGSTLHCSAALLRLSTGQAACHHSRQASNGAALPAMPLLLQATPPPLAPQPPCWNHFSARTTSPSPLALSSQA
jgi:hypothetical protein